VAGGVVDDLVGSTHRVVHGGRAETAGIARGVQTYSRPAGST